MTTIEAVQQVEAFLAGRRKMTRTGELAGLALLMERLDWQGVNWDALHVALKGCKPTWLRTGSCRDGVRSFIAERIPLLKEPESEARVGGVSGTYHRPGKKVASY